MRIYPYINKIHSHNLNFSTPFDFYFTFKQNSFPEFNDSYPGNVGGGGSRKDRHYHYHSGVHLVLVVIPGLEFVNLILILTQNGSKIVEFSVLSHELEIM